MIEFKDVFFRFPNGVMAISGLNLTIRKGEKVAVVGSNGSGKTTLALLLDSLLKPTEGAILIDGLNTSEDTRAGQIRQMVGLVFQNPDNQLVSTTVEREVAFTLENRNLPVS